MITSVAILAALALSAQPEFDTVILSGGGVLQGTAVEDVPGTDLVILMPDGTTRTIPRAQVVRVGLAEPPAQPVPPPAQAEPLPPPHPESAARPPTRLPPPKRGPLGLGIWIAGAFPGGALDDSGVVLSSYFSTQAILGFEASWRVIEPLDLGAYLRIGWGASGPSLKGWCQAVGGNCDAFSLGLGAFPRLSFAPGADANPWVQVGGGFEYLTASNAKAGVDYVGWETGAWIGVDLRASRAGAIGFFGGVRWGKFTSGSASGGLPVAWGGAAGHRWMEAGVRFASWP